MSEEKNFNLELFQMERNPSECLERTEVEFVVTELKSVESRSEW